MHPVILLLLSSITTDCVWLLILTRCLDHTQRRTTVGRTPLNEWSVRRKDLYLTTHNNHNKHPYPPTCWRFLFTLKIRRLRPGLNPRTWLSKVSAIMKLASFSGRPQRRCRPSLHTDIGWFPSLSVLDSNTRGTSTSPQVTRSPDTTRAASVNYQLKICFTSAISEQTFQSILLPLLSE